MPIPPPGCSSSRFLTIVSRIFCSKPLGTLFLSFVTPTPHCRSFVILMNHYVVNLKVASRPHKIWFQQKTITYICYTSYCSLLPSNHQSSSLAINIINTKWVILDIKSNSIFWFENDQCNVFYVSVSSRH